MKKVLLAVFLVSLALANSPAVRIKDIATVSGVRSNQLMGVGLVAGLRGTGDASSVVTEKALTNLLVNMGATKERDLFRSRNTAVVMVTAELPPFVKAGQKIDVFVSSIGDATSLANGSLLMTPLRGADDNVYAVAQGPIVLGGSGATARNATVCKVIEGAIVEAEVPTEYIGRNSIALNLNRSDFSTATRVAEALERGGYAGTRPLDAATIEIPITPDDRENMVAFVARIQDFMIIPDAVARVVINQRTGTVVIGDNVRLAPVAISHGEVEIRIDTEQETSSGVSSVASSFGQESQETSEEAKPQPIRLVHLREGSSLSSLVKALNSVGTSPQDLIAIIQALKTAGALAAEIEVI